MKSTPINDFFVKNGRIRPDGLHVHEMHLFQVKNASRVKGALGLLQASRDHSGGSSLLADGYGRLPVRGREAVANTTLRFAVSLAGSFTWPGFGLQAEEVVIARNRCCWRERANTFSKPVR